MSSFLFASLEEATTKWSLGQEHSVCVWCVWCVQSPQLKERSNWTHGVAGVFGMGALLRGVMGPTELTSPADHCMRETLALQTNTCSCVSDRYLKASLGDGRAYV